MVHNYVINYLTEWFVNIWIRRTIKMLFGHCFFVWRIIPYGVLSFIAFTVAQFVTSVNLSNGVISLTSSPYVLVLRL